MLAYFEVSFLGTVSRIIAYFEVSFFGTVSSIIAYLEVSFFGTVSKIIAYLGESFFGRVSNALYATTCFVLVAVVPIRDDATQRPAKATNKTFFILNKFLRFDEKSYDSEVSD